MTIVSWSQSTSQFDTINAKLDLLLAGNGSGMTFTLLSLAPTYTLNSSNGWSVTPTSLGNIYDGDSNTSTNLFEIGGSSYRYGEILIAPGIAIPTYTRINLRIGLQNSNGQRSYFEAAAYNTSSAVWQPFWATIDNQSNTQDLIVNIDRILPFTWDKLRFQLWDIGQFSARTRIYDLRIWEVS